MRKRREIAQYHGWWGDAQKLEAVQAYLMLGTIKLTSAATEIPEKTLISWRNSPWWQEIVDELRLQDKLQLSSKLKKIVEKSLEGVEDRIENGDFHFDMNGKLKRKPVSLKDLQRVSLEMINKKEDILATEKVVMSDAKVDEKLKTLAEKFAAYAKRAIKQTDATDAVFVETTDAVHVEEREEGLQEAVREV